MVSSISLLWILLSIIVAATCTFSFTQPIWITHPDFVHSFGLFGYCTRNELKAISRPICEPYGGTFDFYSIPSGAWQASCLFFGGGCMLLCVASFLTVLSLFKQRSCRKPWILVTSYIQILSTLIMIGGLVIYPMGFNTPFYKYYCGDMSAMYDTGHCRMGWSYMLAVMGTSLSIFCPILSYFTDLKEEDLNIHDF